MNIIEAIKSKKNFKRKKHILWVCDLKPGVDIFDKEDILADDWEIEPEPEQKIDLSWKEIKNAFMVATPAIWQLSPYERDLKARLGFKE